MLTHTRQHVAFLFFCAKLPIFQSSLPCHPILHGLWRKPAYKKHLQALQHGRKFKKGPILINLHIPKEQQHKKADGPGVIPAPPNPKPHTQTQPHAVHPPWVHHPAVLLSSLFSRKRFYGEENLRREVLPCTTHHRGVQSALPAGGRTKHACIARSPAAPLLKGPRSSNPNQARPAAFSSCVSARFSPLFSSRALQCHEHHVLPIPQPRQGSARTLGEHPSYPTPPLAPPHPNTRDAFSFPH